jgi:signal transduction histidine kinase/HPt (histidine-containing phosphotransfer) domain-containing protein/FixJ family two-component response regulator
MTQFLIQPVMGIILIISIAIMIIIMSHWGQPRMKYLSFLAVLITVDNIGYFFQICAVSLDSAVVAFKFQMFGGPYLGLVSILFGLDYIGRPINNKMFRYLLYAPAAVITVIAAGMDFLPGLLITNARMVSVGNSVQFLFDFGPFYFVYLIYNFSIYILFSIIIIWHFISSKRGMGHNIVFITIAILPLAAKFISFAGFANNLDLYPVTRTVSLILLYWYTMRYQDLEWRNLGWEAIVGRLTDAVVVLNANGRIININPAFHSYFSSFPYTENKSTLDDFTTYLRQHMLESYPESLFDDLDKNFSLQHSAIGGDLRQGEFSISPQFSTGQGGAPVKQSFTLTAQAVRKNDQVMGQIVILNDVSIYRNMIDQIIELKQRAEAASRSKSEFLATMSHEIRTPLNAIIGFSEILLQKKLPHEAHTDLEQIYNSGSVLLGIISDILDISKIESGNLELMPVGYTIPSMINDTIHLNLVRIGSRHIQFELDIDETVPRRLMGDELRVKQILNNLLSNAIKYTDEGKVSLHVNWKSQGGDVALLIFTVSDTGQGIKKENLGKLFSQYLQFNSKRSIEGTGLGLSITKTLVELMDGTLQVESEYGKGSTFTVTVLQEIVDPEPVGKEIADNLKQFRFINTRRKERNMFRTRIPNGRILVVDDMQTNIDVARGLMLSYGMTIDGLTSGREAVEAVRAEKTKYDIIFMDHMMPEIDGIEASRMIRAIGSDYARRIPIVALTANALAGNMELFLQNGINDFLAKPVDVQRLNAVLEKWIPREKQIKTIQDLEEQESQAHFPAITGVDVGAGINNTGGTLNGYKRILDIFISDTKNRLPQIKTAYEEENWEKYAILVHAMKGAFKIIGAAEAAETASRLEDAARQGDKKLLDAETENMLALFENMASDVMKAVKDSNASGQGAESK